MTSLPAAAGRAMAVRAKQRQRPQTPDEIIAGLRVQLAIVEHERDVLKEEIDRLNKENDALALKAHRAAKTNGSGQGTYVNGRKMLTQKEAAKILRVDQAQISRWVKSDRIKTEQVPGRVHKMIPADTLRKPDPGKRGRKSK